MQLSKKYIWTISVTLILLIAFLWTCVPKPSLTISILIRLAASAIAFYIVIKYREWKVFFLGAMFFLMATRQILTLLIWLNIIEQNTVTRTLSEIPGFVVTLLSLVSIIYLGLMLSGQVKLIQKQEENITTLKRLLPICSKCKKIRDDSGYWNELETYIESHTDSQFSHGLCEKCSDELYGDQEWYQKSKKKRENGS